MPNTQSDSELRDYDTVLDILVDALERGQIEMGLPKNSQGKGGYSISNELTKRLAKLVNQERTKAADIAAVEARLDEQKRTDGAYLRFHVKESKEGDYVGAETDWMSHEERIAKLEAELAALQPNNTSGGGDAN